jgi:hypothetical protein
MECIIYHINNLSFWYIILNLDYLILFLITSINILYLSNHYIWADKSKAYDDRIYLYKITMMCIMTGIFTEFVVILKIIELIIVNTSHKFHRIIKLIDIIPMYMLQIFISSVAMIFRTAFLLCSENECSNEKKLQF